MSSTHCSLAVHALILWAMPHRMMRPMYSHEGIRGYIPHIDRAGLGRTDWGRPCLVLVDEKCFIHDLGTPSHGTRQISI
jgi:hypothetical protein